MPTAINGTKVPFNLFTDEEIDAINAVRTMRAGMAGTQANLIPTNQSGSGLQTAQAEANENSVQVRRMGSTNSCFNKCTRWYYE